MAERKRQGRKTGTGAGGARPDPEMVIGDSLAEPVEGGVVEAPSEPAAAEILQADVAAEVPVAPVDVPVVSDELKAIVEALIFASPEPLTLKALYKVLSSEPKEDVELALEALKLDYEQPGGLQLIEIAGGMQIVTRTDLNEWVRRLFHERKTTKLSVQALETLAVIAYRQPVTSVEIAEIRGVNTSGVLATLMERKLVKIAGRKQVVGRPFLYATTREFLMRFGLNDLADLPKVEDMADLLGFDLSTALSEPMPADQMLPLEVPGDEVVQPAGSPDEVTADEVTSDETTPSGETTPAALPLDADGPGDEKVH